MEELTRQLQKGEELNQRRANVVAEFLLDEDVSDERKAALLKALSSKGETPQEIAYLVEVFLEHAIDPKIDQSVLDGPTLDVCGTGGDGLHLFNVSTTSMFVAAAAGAYVIKHGNRGITSRSGGADVLEALGVVLTKPNEEHQKCLEEAGITFLFAPDYHPAFKAVSGVRKLLASEGRRTVFNVLGPLLNPARPQCQLVGVMERHLAPAFAEILQRLGRESVWAVHGRTSDSRSVDEISLMGSTRICKAGVFEELEDEEVRPRDFGLQTVSVKDLQGSDAEGNAKILVDILEGKDTGPRLDMVLLNAGAALACSGLSDDLGSGIDYARKLISDGSALERLRKLQSFG